MSANCERATSIRSQEHKSTIPTLELILASAIWGFAFVAQRKGNESLNPLFFNSLRFALGSLFLLILLILKTNKLRFKFKPDLLILGAILFVAASLQQIGLLWTTAGSGGFITGLYVVFIPLIGLLKKQKASKNILLSILLAVTGLWLINTGVSIKASTGNLLVLLSAVFWALHVQYIDTITKRYPSLWIAFCQYSVCAILSLAFWALALLSNLIQSSSFKTLFANITQTGYPLLYSGIASVGIAYTLQLHAQKKVAPSPAGIILCMEAVFALLGGWWLLHENMTLSSIAGAGLLLLAMLLAQMAGKVQKVEKVEKV